MGGVTQELDSVRRSGAAKGTSTTGLYHLLLSRILCESVRIDVIAGASAGGINGALLAAAIANDKPLTGLGDIWLNVGDLAKLMRSPVKGDPPSLLQGNEILLAEVRKKLCELYEHPANQPAERPADVDGTGQQPALYLYVMATNLLGRRRMCQDSTARPFEEFDSRHRFAFESAPATVVEQTPPTGAAVPLASETAACQLAAAARASSSFPVAFEPAGPIDGQWFLDGGVLDNQPFAPVLDRIAALPARVGQVKRVVGYVVPYVTEPGTVGEGTPALPPALKTLTASSKLPRDQAKLLSLDRVSADYLTQRIAEVHRKAMQDLVLDAADGQPAMSLGPPAAALFPAYCVTRRQAIAATLAGWATEDFVSGDGRAGQDPAIVMRTAAVADLDRDAATLRSKPPLMPCTCRWSAGEGSWEWGLSPAERVATWALLALRGALENHPDARALVRARELVSQLVWDLRALKQQLSAAFAAGAAGLGVGERAVKAYGALRVVDGDRPSDGLAWLQSRFTELDGLIEQALKELPDLRLPRIEALLHVEVLRNAMKIDDDATPFPFDFVFMSAGCRNSLGHELSSPETKLGGMKLGHFGGFVKRSWRANDWLWGRLDGVEHILRATLDIEHLRRVKKVNPQVAADLAAFAFSDADPGRETLERLWKSHPRASGPGDKRTATEQLEEVVDRAIEDHDLDALERCRAALAARIQLQILAEELKKVADAADADVRSGSSVTADGARWAHDVAAACKSAGDAGLTDGARVGLFTQMQIGSESLTPEIMSRPGLSNAAQAIAVAAAILDGKRGGVPGIARKLLIVVRGPTLALWGVTRLVAHRPWVGAFVVGVLCYLTDLGARSDGKLVSLLVPTMVALCAVLVAALIVMATGAMRDTPRRSRRLVAGTIATLLPSLLVGLAVDVVDLGGREWLVGLIGAVAADIAIGLMGVAALAAGYCTWLINARGGRGARRSGRWVNGYRVTILVVVGVVTLGAPLHDARLRWSTEADGVAIAVACVVVLVVAAWLGSTSFDRPTEVEP